jgi:hypothetical protein
MPTTVIGNIDLFGADSTVMASSSLSSICFHAGVSDTSTAIAHHSTASIASTAAGLPDASRLSERPFIDVSIQLGDGSRKPR